MKPEEHKRLANFCERLTQLSRETGVLIEGAGDWPVVYVPIPDNMAELQRGHYKLETWGRIEWQSIS